jgi:hypothetical protein
MGLLCAERVRELREAADVGEEDNDLTTLGLHGTGRFRFAPGDGIAQAGDGFEQPLTMAERRDASSSPGMSQCLHKHVGRRTFRATTIDSQTDLTGAVLITGTASAASSTPRVRYWLIIPMDEL